jgi:hypothetical protein
MVPERDETWIGLVLQLTSDGRKFVARIWPVEEKDSSLTLAKNMNPPLRLERAVIEPLVEGPKLCAPGAPESERAGFVCQSESGTYMRVLGEGAKPIFVDLRTGAWFDDLQAFSIVWYPAWRILLAGPNEFVPIASFP